MTLLGCAQPAVQHSRDRVHHRESNMHHANPRCAFWAGPGLWVEVVPQVLTAGRLLADGRTTSSRIPSVPERLRTAHHHGKTSTDISGPHGVDKLSGDDHNGAMVNERFRRAMHRSGHDLASLAAAAEVSTKSVERWIAGDSIPYPRTRYRVAAVLGEDEGYLWPEAVNGASLAGAELVATYPRRNDVPRHLWTELLRASQRNVDVLAFAGLFLAEEHSDWVPTLAAKAEAGVRVRLLLGDPQGSQLAARDLEYKINGGVAGRVTSVLGHYAEQLPGSVEVRLHDTPLYNSIYRFDDELIINHHVYGILAAFTPTTHLRRIDGAYVNTYLESFERVWGSARDQRQTRQP